MRLYHKREEEPGCKPRELSLDKVEKGGKTRYIVTSQVFGPRGGEFSHQRITLTGNELAALQTAAWEDRLKVAPKS